MTSPQRRRLSLALAMLGAVIIAVIWLALPRDGLLDHAVPLVPAAQWMGSERRNGDIANYVWLTNDEVLILRWNRDKTVTLLRKRVIPQGQDAAAVPMALESLRQPEAVTVSPDGGTMHVRYFNPTVPRRKAMTSRFV